jgi:urease accessory protein UreH
MDTTRSPARTLIAGRRDQRATPDVGRRARLELVFAKRRGRTVLADAYAEPPFRVGRCFPDGGDGVRLILAWAAPGIFGGDELHQTIRLEPGARVSLASQSALQVHPASRSLPRSASLHSQFQVAADARLLCQWDPLIPFADTSFDQRIVLGLAGNAELYWSDAFMAGRVGRGEQWRFRSFKHELRLLRDSTLEYLERYEILPGEKHVTGPWVAGSGCYFGTSLSSGRVLASDEAEQLQDELSGLDGLDGAADRIDSKLLIVKLVGRSGAPFHNARRLVNRRLSPAAEPSKLVLDSCPEPLHSELL